MLLLVLGHSILTLCRIFNCFHIIGIPPHCQNDHVSTNKGEVGGLIFWYQFWHRAPYKVSPFGCFNTSLKYIRWFPNICNDRKVCYITN